MDSVLIHYGEIALKGGNRPWFEGVLQRNLNAALEGIAHEGLSRLHDRFILRLNGRANEKQISESLSRVFGVSWFAFASEAEPSIPQIQKQAQILAKSIPKGSTFRIKAHRSDKSHDFSSKDLENKLGDTVRKARKLKVQLDNPSHTIHIDVLKNRAFVFGEKFRGPGGLPVGSGGKVLALFSGGIDSPVAVWSMLSRGCDVEMLHFHAFRKNSDAAKTKIPKLVSTLTKYGAPARINLAPITQFQFRALKIPEKYDLILFRRFMLRVAQEFAKKIGARAIVTGDSLGQVASQTLDNLATLDEAAEMPVFRPLIGRDKNEIINIAKSINTYELSIQNYKDCCSIIARSPATSSKLDIAKRVENEMDMDGAVRETLELVGQLEA